jgi:hypothetical protein
MDEEPCNLSVEPGKEEQKAKNGQPFKAAEPGWVKFESPRWTFITKEIQGQYPNWRQVIPTTDSKWTKVFLSSEAIEQMLQVIPRLPGDDGINRAVRLRAQAHQLVLDGRNKEDDDWTSIPVQMVNITGKPVTFALNRIYLLQALKFGLNTMEVEDPLSPIVLSNAGNSFQGDLWVAGDMLRKAMSSSMRFLSGEICLVIGVLPLKRSAYAAPTTVTARLRPRADGDGQLNVAKVILH